MCIKAICNILSNAFNVWFALIKSLFTILLLYYLPINGESWEKIWQSLEPISKEFFFFRMCATEYLHQICFFLIFVCNLKFLWQSHNYFKFIISFISLFQVQMDAYFLSWQKFHPTLFGIPILVSCTATTTRKEIYEEVWLQIKRFVSNQKSDRRNQSEK